MNILVIGGTRFFGIHMVNELLTAGHDVTIATRGNASDSFGDKVDNGSTYCCRRIEGRYGR